MKNVLKCAKCFRGWPNPKCCREPLKINEPEVFLAGTEVFAIWGLNSGVMLMNVENMLAHRAALLDFANVKKWSFMMWDQGLLESFYKSKDHTNLSSANFLIKGNHAWDSFDDAVYNARGFMKLNAGQLAPEGPVIWHWHGYKPYDVQCWLDNLDNGKLDLRRDHVNASVTIEAMLRASKTKGNCRGSLNARLALPECSLYLYLSLLAHYYHLLQIADSPLDIFLQ